MAMTDRELLAEMEAQLIKWANESDHWGCVTPRTKLMRAKAQKISTYLNNTPGESIRINKLKEIINRGYGELDIETRRPGYLSPRPIFPFYNDKMDDLKRYCFNDLDAYKNSLFNMPFNFLKENSTMQKKIITNEQIVEALKGSIDKWSTKVDTFAGTTILQPIIKVAGGHENCPLCKLFGWRRGDPLLSSKEPECSLCPLKSCGKNGDLYMNVFYAETNLEAHTASVAMVDRMKALLAEYEQKVKEEKDHPQVGDIVGYKSEFAKAGERQIYEVMQWEVYPKLGQLLLRASDGRTYTVHARAFTTIYRPAK